MSVIVVATVVPKAGALADVVAAFEEAIARVHGEDGCRLYALHEGEDRLVMIEKWADDAALAVHGRGAALAALRAALDGRIVGDLDVQVLRPHPAGDPGRGAL